jgi:hypothetical protein
MWRAVFAFALVDNMLSIEEQKLLKVYLDTVPFSDAQRAVLRADFKTPQNVEALYKKIANRADRERFCVLARALVWCEGNMDRQEERILRRVSCLADDAHDDVLRRTRKHPHLDSYYEHYAKAGVAGMMKISPRFSRKI